MASEARVITAQSGQKWCARPGGAATIGDVEHLVERLAAIRGVVAVTLGGSRAVGEEEPDSDWDFGLYYRETIDVDAVRALGYPGTVTEPGEWVRLMNGGAWLTIDDTRVDLLYRDLAFVEHWSSEAERGHFEIDNVPGYLAGMPTYATAGELALNRVLHGALPVPEFSDALRDRAVRVWQSRSAFSLDYARSYEQRGLVAERAAMLTVAALEEAQARMADQRAWVVNEKRLLERAGLGHLRSRLPAATVDEVSGLLTQ